METILKKTNFLGAFFLLGLIISCNSEHIFNEYQSIDKNSWDANQKISFNFKINDTISKRNLFINLRNNKNYEFSNLYVITSLNFPNGTKIVDTLQYEMTDAQGRFLGTGFSDVKENKLFYKEGKVFPVSGAYTFEVYHAMRRNGKINGIESLKGITAIGLSIEKLAQ